MPHLSSVVPCLLLGACAHSAPEPSPVPEVAGCSAESAGELGTMPIGWAPGSTPEHAAWAVADGWGTEGGVVAGEAAWVVHDALWVARGAILSRHPLSGGEGVPLDLAELLQLSEGLQVVAVSVVDEGDAVSGVWIALRGEVGSRLVHLMPDGPSASWNVAATFPADGPDPVRYVDLQGAASRAVVAFEDGSGARGAQVVSRRGKPLRRVALSPSGDGIAGLGLLGQGVLSVRADEVVLDRPGHRFRAPLPGLRQLAMGTEGFLGVGREGQLVSRVREGVELVSGFTIPDVVSGVATRGDAAVAIVPVDGRLEVVRGSLRPDVVGPSWAPVVTSPTRCRLDGDADLVLPPVVGPRGVVLLAVRAPAADPEAPPHPVRLWTLP